MRIGQAAAGRAEVGEPRHALVDRQFDGFAAAVKADGCRGPGDGRPEGFAGEHIVAPASIGFERQVRRDQQADVLLLRPPFDFAEEIGHRDMRNEAVTILDQFDIEHGRTVGVLQHLVAEGVAHHRRHPGERCHRDHRRRADFSPPGELARDWRKMSGWPVHVQHNPRGQGENCLPGTKHWHAGRRNASRYPY